MDNLMYTREKAAYIFDHDFPEIENFYSDSLADTPLALIYVSIFVSDLVSRSQLFS